MKPAKIDPKAAKLHAPVPGPEALFALALDEAAGRVWGAGLDGFLYSFDWKAEKPTAIKSHQLHENYVSGLVLRGSEIISCGYDKKLNWTIRESGKSIRSVSAHDGWIRKLVHFAEGERLATVADDMILKIWDAKTGKVVATMKGHEAQTPEGPLSALYALAVSSNGQFAATGDRAGFVRVWDLKTEKRVAGFRAPEFYTFDAVKRARAIGGIRGLAFSPDGSQLAISGIGPVTNVDGFVGPCRIELWDWKAEKRLAVGQDKHNAILNDIAFAENGQWLIAVGGGDSGGAMVFWSGKESAPPVLAKPKGHLHAFVLAAGPRLIAAGHGGFQVWSLT